MGMVNDDGAPIYDSVQLVRLTPISLWLMVRK